MCCLLHKQSRALVLVRVCKYNTVQNCLITSLLSLVSIIYLRISFVIVSADFVTTADVIKNFDLDALLSLRKWWDGCLKKLADLYFEKQ